MSWKQTMLVAFALMAITGVQAYRQVTDAVVETAVRAPVSTGSSVLRLVRQTLERQEVAGSDAPSALPGLVRLAGAFGMTHGDPMLAADALRPAAGPASSSGGSRPANATRRSRLDLTLKAVLTKDGLSTALIATPDGTVTARRGTQIGEERVVHVGSDHVVLDGPSGGRELRFGDAVDD